MEVLYVFYSVTDGKLNKAFLHFLTIFFGILPSLKVELIKRHFELLKNQMCQIFVQKLKKCLIKPALKNPHYSTDSRSLKTQFRVPNLRHLCFEIRLKKTSKNAFGNYPSFQYVITKLIAASQRDLE